MSTRMSNDPIITRESGRCERKHSAEDGRWVKPVVAALTFTMGQGDFKERSI